MFKPTIKRRKSAAARSKRLVLKPVLVPRKVSQWRKLYDFLGDAEAVCPEHRDEPRGEVVRSW